MFEALSTCFSALISNPKGISFDGEDADEKILLLLRRHIITNVRWVLTSFAFAILPFALTYFLSLYPSTLPVFLPFPYIIALYFSWYLFVFIYTFEAYLNWYFNVYIVTDKRVVDVDFFSLLSRQVSDAPISNIQDVTYNVQGIFQTIFDYGTVTMQTAGEKEHLEFDLVPRPAFVQNELSDLATKASNGDI